MLPRTRWRFKGEAVSTAANHGHCCAPCTMRTMKITSSARTEPPWERASYHRCPRRLCDGRERVKPRGLIAIAAPRYWGSEPHDQRLAVGRFDRIGPEPGVRAALPERRWRTADVVDGDDVGMVQCSGCTSFLLEAGQPLRVGRQPGGQDFEATSRPRRGSGAL